MQKIVFFTAAIFLFLTSLTHAEPEIQVVETDIAPVWLVQSDALPMVSAQVAFRAGSAFDPKGMEGLSHLTAALLDEGAGRYLAEDFSKMLQNHGIRLSAGSDRLNLTVHLTTTTEHMDKAFELLGYAVTRPRFGSKDVERVKSAIMTGILASEQNPASVAEKAYYDAMYGDHPYAHPTEGYLDTVKVLDRPQLKNFHRDNFTRSNMVISVVGDITPEQVKKLVEENLRRLRDGDGRNAIEKGPVKPVPAVIKIERDIPQSHVLMGHLGISRWDPDYFAAYAMNYILGGGGFNSWMMEEIREKRGLAYGVYSYFEPLPKIGNYTAAVQTKNKDVWTSIRLIKEQIVKMRNKGVSKEDYEKTMNYLSGSFPLRIDSNNKILNYLTVMQMENLGKYYLQNWVDIITRIPKEDFQRVAMRLLHPEDMVVVIVGKPEAATE